MISIKKTKTILVIILIILFSELAIFSFIKFQIINNLLSGQEESFIVKQQKSIELLRGNTQSLTEEEINKQIEEMERLRNQK